MFQIFGGEKIDIKGIKMNDYIKKKTIFSSSFSPSHFEKQKTKRTPQKNNLEYSLLFFLFFFLLHSSRNKFFSKEKKKKEYSSLKCRIKKNMNKKVFHSKCYPGLTRVKIMVI